MVVLKFWENTSMSEEVLAVFEEAIIESLSSVGIWIGAFFKDLTVF